MTGKRARSKLEAILTFLALGIGCQLLPSVVATLLHFITLHFLLRAVHFFLRICRRVTKLVWRFSGCQPTKLEQAWMVKSHLAFAAMILRTLQCRCRLLPHHRNIFKVGSTKLCQRSPKTFHSIKLHISKSTWKSSSLLCTRIAVWITPLPSRRYEFRRLAF